MNILNSRNSFFIPIKGFMQNLNNTINIEGSHIYRAKQFHLLKEENIKWWNKPYFAILNENDVVKNFINAIMSNDFDGAKLYISKNVLSNLNLDELGELFDGDLKYKYSLNCYFDNNSPKGVNKVTIAAKSNEGKKYNHLIHVQMIDEPDMYGKWKIYKIEKE